MAKKMFLTSGIGRSILVFLVGTAVLSVLYNFWIAPYIFSGYTVTTAAQWISGIIAFQIPAIVFLLIIGAWWLGYFGIQFSAGRRSRRLR